MGNALVKKRPAKKPPRCVISIQPDIHARIRAIVDPEGRKIQWFAERALLEALERAEMAQAADK